MIIRHDFAHRHTTLPPLTRHRLCNPSVVRLPGGRFGATVRGVNYDLKHGYKFSYGSAPCPVPDTQNSFAILRDDFSIESHELIDDRQLRANALALDGIEDLRLFHWDNGLWVLGSALHYTPTPKNTMLLAGLNDDGRGLSCARFIPSPLQAPVEKNWMPRVEGNRLFFVYTVSPFAQFEYVDGALKPANAQRSTSDLGEGLSGSSQIVRFRGREIGVVHRKTFDHAKRSYTYRHFVVTLRGGAPERIGRKFSFDGSPIEFCSGLEIVGDRVVMSYGVMDQQACFIEISADDMERLL